MPVGCSSQSRILRMGRQGTDLKLVARDLDLVTIERPGSRSAQHCAVDGKHRRMARTQEVLRVLIPVVGASEMRALRCECDGLVVTGLDNPRRRFLATYFPAIHFVDAKRDFLR